MKDTIYEGLMLEREWAIKNEFNIIDTIEECETVSESLERMVYLLKKEEFGVELEISEYEKKLIFTGLQMSSILVMMQNYERNIST
jgi:hypothetical protein